MDAATVFLFCAASSEVFELIRRMSGSLDPLPSPWTPTAGTMSSSPRQTSPIALTPAPPPQSSSSFALQQPPPPQLSRPPARASTTGSQNDDGRPRVTVPTSARSEDLHSYNHEYGGGNNLGGLGSGREGGGSAGRQRLLSASRPSTPTSGSEHRHGSSAGEHDAPGDRQLVPAPASVASSSST